MNLELQFNINVIKRIKSYNFTVDKLGSALFVLFALYESRIDLLDEFDDGNKQRTAHLLYKELELNGLIERTDHPDSGDPLYFLTKEGVKLVEYIQEEFVGQDEPISTERIAVSGVDSLKEAYSADDPETWIDEWVDIFPRGVRSGGKLIRSDRAGCLRKMKMFIRDYKYDRATIMTATRRYIDIKAREGYNYTRCAIYFIYKTEKSKADEHSELAAWCEEVLASPERNPENNNLEIMA